MDKVTELIEKHGPEIANQLKIATDQVYTKVLWYIQVDGVLGLSKVVLTVLITGIPLLILSIKWLKYIRSKDADDELGFAGFWGLVILGILGLLFTSILVDHLVTQVAKIVAPEYWLINQIISKVGQ